MPYLCDDLRYPNENSSCIEVATQRACCDRGGCASRTQGHSSASDSHRIASIGDCPSRSRGGPSPGKAGCFRHQHLFAPSRNRRRSAGPCERLAREVRGTREPSGLRAGESARGGSCPRLGPRCDRPVGGSVRRGHMRPSPSPATLEFSEGRPQEVGETRPCRACPDPAARNRTGALAAPTKLASGPTPRPGSRPGVRP